MAKFLIINLKCYFHIQNLKLLGKLFPFLLASFVGFYSAGFICWFDLYALLPRTYRQEKVKELIMTAYSAGEYRPPFDEMVPFAIPAVLPTVSKFIYVSPNVIIKVGFSI